MTDRTRRFVRSMLTALLAGGATLLAAPIASASLPAIHHVFVIVEENESESTTFGAGSPAPYLSTTLTSEGAFLKYYYGIGHNSLDNYIAMVSGQAANPDTSADCGTFLDFTSDGFDANGQETGNTCVYPVDVPSLMSQLDIAGLTWRGYMDSMGADTTRDNPTNPGDANCGHPALNGADVTQSQSATDQYATRHDPFVYFHYVINNQAECDRNVVPLTQLSNDLQNAATTPNYVFITPGLCDDGHDATCQSGTGAGGLGQADTFLKTLVPEITGSPAFQQSGLLIIVFDEATGGDASACCGEYAGPLGPVGGGGLVGAVALSPFIAPGTVSTVPYNHFSMLGTVEDIFGLPRLGEAAGTTPFGPDVFTQPNGPTTTTTTTTPTSTTTTPTTTTTTSTPTTTTPTTTTPTPPAPKPVAPQVSHLTVKPSPFAVPAKASDKNQLKIVYRDTEAASTKLSVVRLNPGYVKAHHGCTALKSGQTRPKNANKCTVKKTIGSLKHQDKVGSNTVMFDGKLKGHALAPGSYEFTLVPSANNLTGKSLSAQFKIVTSGH